MKAAHALQPEINDRRVPKVTEDSALRVIREMFRLPQGAKLKRYLEEGIDPKGPDEYMLPIRPPL